MAKFSIASYNISEEDKTTIMLCREKFPREAYAFKRLADFLQSGTNFSLKEWNEDICELYISSLGYRECTLRKHIAFLNYVLQMSESTARVSQSLSKKYCTIPFEFFYSFSQFDAYINSIRNRFIPNLRYKNTIDVYTPMIAVYYLIWLGLDASEINNLKLSDVDSKTFTIKVGERVICFEDYYPICNLFKRYMESTEMIVYGKPKNTPRKFVGNGSFIKLTRKSDAIRTISIIQRAKAVFGLSAVQISYSGKFDRMYDFELQNGIDLTKASSKTAPYVEKLLGVKLFTGKEYQVSAAKEYAREYSEYKTARKSLDQVRGE